MTLAGRLTRVCTKAAWLASLSELMSARHDTLFSSLRILEETVPFPPAHILPSLLGGGWYNSIVTHRIIYLECWRVVALLYCSRDLLRDNKNVVSSLGRGKIGKMKITKGFKQVGLSRSSTSLCRRRRYRHRRTTLY